MIVAVYARYSDMCGNRDQYLHGYYEVDSIAQAKAVFPSGFMVGWEVHEFDNPIKTLPTTVQKVPDEKHYR